MIRTFDYRRSLAEISDQVDAALRRVLASGVLIHGPETLAFEREFAAYVGARHCIAVSSGTTALHLALWAIGVRAGDEVITVSNTCVPTVSSIRLAGASPVFVDVRADDLLMDVEQIEERITPRTRCILPVHLWGAPVDLSPLVALARRHSLAVVEDCAQAQGTRYEGRRVGTFGAAGCFSFYPTKNIGAYGDAGAVVTDDDELALALRRIRTYGYDDGGLSVMDGTNARASEMQCAVLRIKLQVYPEWLTRRLRVAARYDAGIRNPRLLKPMRREGCESSYHQYVVRSEERAALARWLARHDIGFGIHYPVPVHRMPAYEGFARRSPGLPVTERAAECILSLPIHEALTGAEVDRVIEVLERFGGGQPA